MAVSKVVLGNQTVMDITDSTVDANSLLSGKKAYGANGEPIIGAVVTAEVVDNLTTNNGSKALSARQGYLLNYHLDQTATLSTTDPTVYTFTDSAITTDSDIDVHASVFGVWPSNVVVTTGQCVVTFPKQETAQSMTCRIYIR